MCFRHFLGKNEINPDPPTERVKKYDAPLTFHQKISGPSVDR